MSTKNPKRDIHFTELSRPTAIIDAFALQFCKSILNKSLLGSANKFVDKNKVATRLISARHVIKDLVTIRFHSFLSDRKKTRYPRTHGRTDPRTDGPTDGRNHGRTHPLIES